MADNDRGRNVPYQDRDRDDERDRFRGEGSRGDDRGYGRDHGSDEGFIARRGFGNESAGYDRDRGSAADRSGYGAGGFSDRYGGDVGRRDYGSGGFGAENYGRSYQDYPGGRSGSYDRDRDYGRGSSEYERSGWDRTTDEIASWFGDDDAARRREQDARQDAEGARLYRGRGPKGYTRSDERIREDVCDRLTDDPLIDASEVEVSVSNCEVTLSGMVNRRDDKRRAEDLAESVSGVRHVQNNLRVGQGTGTGTTAGRGASTTAASTTAGTADTSGAATTDVEMTRTEGRGTARRGSGTAA
jgi:osmotically-inducible protein OsmY